jgi:broad specificity phosphatase PhoE
VIKIYIARHGETTWNAEMRIQGRSDTPLSPKGHVQSLDLLAQLKDWPIAAIYTSALQRSIQTAQPVARHFGLPLHERAELNEMAFGILEGKQLADMDETMRVEWERFKENRSTYRIPGAESYLDVANRVQPFTEEILRKHRGQEILVVGHRVVNRMLIGFFLECGVGQAEKIEQSNGCIYLIQRNGEPKAYYFLDGKMREGLLLQGQR